MITDLAPLIPSVDSVHVHGVWEGCLADLHACAARAAIPFFVSAHGMLDRWSVAQSRWKKWLAMHVLRTGTMLRRADAIVYGTDEEAAQGKDFVRSRSAVVPNGIDTERLVREDLPDDADLIAMFPQIDDWDTVVLFFSRIHPKKGLDLLIEAFIDLADANPGAGLLIAGIAQDRHYEAALRRRIEESGHGERIVFTTDLTGPRARAVFRRADIFALPSHQEGFSMAVLEAMALSTPVLITTPCHLPEVETLWRAGLVVSDTLKGVRDGLAEMLALNPAVRARIGENGRSAVVEHYDWDVVAESLEQLYNSAARK